MQISEALLERMKQVSIDFNTATGKSLALVGEIAEQEVAKALKLQLTSISNNPGYDAIDNLGNKYEIKSAVRQKYLSTTTYSIQKTKSNYDVILFAVYSKRYELIAVYSINKRKYENINASSSAAYRYIRLSAVIEHGVLVHGKRPEIKIKETKIKEQITAIDGISRSKAITLLLEDNIDMQPNDIVRAIKDMGYEGTVFDIKKQIATCRHKMKSRIKYRR